MIYYTMDWYPNRIKCFLQVLLASLMPLLLLVRFNKMFGLFRSWIFNVGSKFSDAMIAKQCLTSSDFSRWLMKFSALDNFKRKMMTFANIIVFILMHERHGSKLKRMRIMLYHTMKLSNVDCMSINLLNSIFSFS